MMHGSSPTHNQPAYDFEIAYASISDTLTRLLAELDTRDPSQDQFLNACKNVALALRLPYDDELIARWIGWLIAGHQMLLVDLDDAELIRAVADTLSQSYGPATTGPLTKEA